MRAASLRSPCVHALRNAVFRLCQRLKRNGNGIYHCTSQKKARQRCRGVRQQTSKHAREHRCEPASSGSRLAHTTWSFFTAWTSVAASTCRAQNQPVSTKEGLQGRLTSAPAGANTGLAPHYSEGYQCLARRAHTQSVAASAVVKERQGGASKSLTQLALCITRRWSRTLGGELAQRLASQTRPAWCRPVRQRQQT
jgi:hypothetical protein